MDPEDLIICIAIWTLYKLCGPLISDEVREISIASQNKLRFTSLWRPIFKDFGSPNGFPNLIFEVFFLMLLFIPFEHPILVDFSRLRTKKIMIFPRENNDFCKNCVFDKSAQIAKLCLRFRRPKRRKSLKIQIQKRIVLKHRIWTVVPRILGAFWSPKIIKKSQIFEKIDVRRRPL